MEKERKTRCGNTVLQVDGGAAALTKELDVWARMMAKQADLTRKAANAAELVGILWGALTDEQRAALNTNDQICYQLKQLIGYGYGWI